MHNILSLIGVDDIGQHRLDLAVNLIRKQAGAMWPPATSTVATFRLILVTGKYRGRSGVGDTGQQVGSG